MDKTEEITKEDVMRLFERFTIELTPKAVVQAANHLEQWFAPSQKIYVTFLPKTDINITLDTCASLQDKGFLAIPHIAVRSLESTAQADAVLKRIQSLGLREILLLGGAVSLPKGPYSSVGIFLQQQNLGAYGIEAAGFAGHPEGSPDMTMDEVYEAEKYKQEYADKHGGNYYFMTQFCFQASPVIDWVRHLRAEQVSLPIHVGVPGVASTKALIGHARACGVGNSMNYLLRYGRNLRHLARLNTPEHLVYDLALHQKNAPENLAFSGLHFFPLGGLKNTMNWIGNICNGHFTIHNKKFGMTH